jgi:hypothetical protein
MHLRDEGGVVRQGFNIYPRSSGSMGFLLALGRLRFMLRYSKITSWFDCYVWREETRDAPLEI